MLYLPINFIPNVINLSVLGLMQTHAASFRRKPESSLFRLFWTPAFAGVTDVRSAISLKLMALACKLKFINTSIGRIQLSFIRARPITAIAFPATPLSHLRGHHTLQSTRLMVEDLFTYIFCLQCR